MKKLMHLLLLVAVTILGISGLTSCDNNNNTEGTKVTYEALLNTGVNGYKINVDINDSQELHNSIDYYFCTDGIGEFDYFAQNSSSGPWNGAELADFDYGSLENVGEDLNFSADCANLPSPYTVTSENMVLEEGQTYEFKVWDYNDSGTIHIRSIGDFNCSEIVD